MKSNQTIFSIGHSTHSWQNFAKLLVSHRITGIADVRSSPFSRHQSQFNREDLKNSLHEIGIAYSFLGRELGGRPKDSQFYCDGVADYERMAQTPTFKEGISRVLKGAEGYRIALMCSEHDPLTCHRCLLVGRQLKREGVNIEHILANGALQSQIALETELLQRAGRIGSDLFISEDERLAAAYKHQSKKVAFVEPTKTEKIVVR